MKRISHWYLFTAVLLLHIIFSFFFVRNNFFSFVNSAHAFLASLGGVYQQVIRGQCSCSALNLDIFFKCGKYGVGLYWPPLPHLFSLWLLFIKPHFLILMIQNILYFSFIMLAIYKITDFFIKDRFFSILAAIIFSFYPTVNYFLKGYEVQLASACFISWGFYFYLKSNSFQNFPLSLCFTVLFIMAMYCDRLTPGLFLCGCFINPSNFKKKKSFLILLGIVFISLLVLSPFYHRWLQCVIEGLKFNRFLTIGQDTSVSGIFNLIRINPGYLSAQLFYYFLSPTDQLLGNIFSVIFLIGIIGFIKFQHKDKRIIIINLLLPLFFFP